MKNNYGSIGCIITFLLTIFCGITLSGCSDERVYLPTLIEDPEQYRGDDIEVNGVIVDFEDFELEGGNLLILLRNRDAILICEFLKDEHQDSLEEGDSVTISGKSVAKGDVVTISGEVDILVGITLLRECRLVE